MVMPTARVLLFLAMYGLLGLMVLAIFVELKNTGETGKVAAAWVVMGVYVAPAVLCFPAMIWHSTVQLRARLGGSTDFYRGMLHAVGGRSAEAAEAFSRYHQTHSDNPRGWEGLALAMLLSRRYEEALDAADRAIQMGRTRVGLWIKGHVFLEVGAGGEALSAFEACVSERPKLPFIETFIGNALIQLRRLEDAKKVLQSQNGRRNIPHTAFALGEAYRLSGISDAALKAYEAAARAAATIEVSPNPLRDRALLACALAEAGRLKEAEEAAQSALAADPFNPQALYAQALIEKQRGDLPGLQATLDRMLEASPPQVVFTLGDPEFTPLLADERFRRLLGRAWLEQNRLLERIRQRAPTSNL
jgi:tetratricopeptide (TPR) repeat protein